MREKLVLLLTLVLFSCSSIQDSQVIEKKPAAPAVDQAHNKEFDKGEVILATELLVKIFDKEMAPVACVHDHEEASLLLRTIRPRMEIVEDDMEALLDNKEDVAALIESCSQSCTCSYVDDLLREHMVPVTPEQQKALKQKRSKKEVNRCLSYAKETFCHSELFKSLSIEKADFSFDEESH